LDLPLLADEVDLTVRDEALYPPVRNGRHHVLGNGRRQPFE